MLSGGAALFTAVEIVGWTPVGAALLLASYTFILLIAAIAVKGGMAAPGINRGRGGPGEPDAAERCDVWGHHKSAGSR